MISIEKNKVQINDVAINQYQKQFQEQHIFICPKLFSDSLQQMISTKLKESSYVQKTTKRKDGSIISQEYCIPNKAIITQLINFKLNQDSVINIVKKISNNSKITSFNGRVYKFEEDEYSFDNWHNDMTEENRLLGLRLGVSINLSETPYDGGEFQIRNRKSKQLHASVKHDHWGSAHFFRIDPELEHMVTKIKGDSPRVAFAGWFTIEPVFPHIKRGT